MAGLREQSSDPNDIVVGIHWHSGLGSIASPCSMDWLAQVIHFTERSRSATDVQAVHGDVSKVQNELCGIQEAADGESLQKSCEFNQNQTHGKIM